MHVPDPNRKKLDAKSELCIFIRYIDTRKAYKLYNPLINKLIVSRDVIFYEGEFMVIRKAMLRRQNLF